jgi:hypothetical protein
MATITKYISLVNEVVATRAASTYAFPKSTATSDLGCGLARIHKADYNPLTAVYFEAVLKTSTTTRTAYATLVKTDLTSVATSVVTTTSATAVRVRSGDISGDANFADDQDWGVQIKRNSTTATISIYSARIIITQTGTISATETQINLGNNEDNYFNPGTSYVDHPYTGLFYWDSSKWDGTLKAYIDLTCEGDAVVTAYAALVDTADNSVVGVGSGIGDGVLRFRGSDFAASLVTGHTYKIQIKDSVAGGTQTRFDVRLVIQQTATPTKTETYLPIRTTEHTATATTHTDLFGYFYWDVSEIDVTSYSVLHEATIKCSDATKTTNVDVNNATDGDLDTRSTSSLTKVLSTSGGLTFTDHTENTAHLRLTATAATATMSGSHLKIQISLGAATPTVNVFDSVTVAETVTVLRGSHNINVFDSVTTTETVTPSIYNKLVNVYDSVNTSELAPPTVTEVNMIKFPNVFDSINVSESTTAQENRYNINVFDSITATENITSKVPTEFINIYDSIQVSEDINALEKTLIASVFDTVNISENITAQQNSYNINVFDSVNVSEGITSHSSPQTLSVYDGVQVSEDVTVIEAELDISVDDLVTATEDITVVRENFIVSVFDDIQVFEDITTELITAITELNVNVFDGITATEEISTLQSNYALNVFDEVTVTENITSSLSEYNIDVSDNATVTEDITTLSSLSDSYDVNVYDPLSVAENLSAIAENLIIEVSDSIIVSESFTSWYSFIQFSVSDNIEVSEITIASLPLPPAEVDVSDNIEVSEDFTGSAVTESYPRLIIVRGRPAIHISGRLYH